jgi:hypothetical protein
MEVNLKENQNPIFDIRSPGSLEENGTYLGSGL